MNFIKSLLKTILFIALFALCINAQSPKDAMADLNEALASTEGKTEFLTAIVIIDGVAHTAHTLHEFNVLKSTAIMCNTLKRAKADGVIDSTQYHQKTAAILEYSNTVRTIRN